MWNSLNASLIIISICKEIHVIGFYTTYMRSILCMLLSTLHSHNTHTNCPSSLECDDIEGERMWQSRCAHQFNPFTQFRTWKHFRTEDIQIRRCARVWVCSALWIMCQNKNNSSQHDTAITARMWLLRMCVCLVKGREITYFYYYHSSHPLTRDSLEDCLPSGNWHMRFHVTKANEWCVCVFIFIFRLRQLLFGFLSVCVCIRSIFGENRKISSGKYYYYYIMTIIVISNCS